MTIKRDESGISLPLVLGAMLLFSVMITLLIGVAVISVRHSDYALQRTEALAAAEAGAQDYVNRLNAYASFDSWTADRTATFRNNPAKAKSLPSIVKDSALARWVDVKGSSNGQYTYNVIGNNNGLIIRSTGRSSNQNGLKRSVEYRVSRNSDSAVAYTAVYGYASVDAYAQQAKLDNTSHHPQGWMGTNRSGRRYTVSEYDHYCGQEGISRWYDCWRPYWNGVDMVEGNYITGAPFTIHGYKSFLNKVTDINEYPKVSGSITIFNSQKDRFTHPSNFEDRKFNYYGDLEAAAMRGRKKVTYFPYDETIGSPSANYIEVSSSEDIYDTCKFAGATQVILYGDEIYVRSPHTPPTFNDRANEWCKNKTPLLRDRTKRTQGPDITKDKIRAGGYLRPMDESSWVKFDGLPNDALFIIKHAVGSCNASALEGANPAGKSNGLGFPGGPPSVSSGEPGQQRNYNCANGDLFIEGATAFRRTFAAEDNIYLTGGIRYTDRQNDNSLPANSDDFLGLLAQRNVIIYNPNPPQGSGCGLCGKMPRTPYALPTREKDINGNDRGGQGTYSFPADWKRMPTKPGDILADPTLVKVPDQPYWLALPYYDAAIIAEQGSFFLENMNSLESRPAVYSSGEKPMQVTVTGSVYSRYSPVMHLDRNTRNGGVEVYGLTHRYIFDDRFTKRLPPGFSGHNDSAYRLTNYAEVFSDHLDPK